MARSWPIHVVVLVIFLAATENYARAPGSEAIAKKRTLLEKLENLVSSAVQSVRTVASNVKTLYRNFDLIGALATEQLHSSFRVIKLLESRRKPDVGVVTKPPVVTTQQRVVTTKKTQTACGDRWKKFGTSFFLFCTCVQNCTFNSARNECREKQAELAKCSSRELETFFVRSLKTTTYILLGGNDRVEEGTWRWPDGSLLNESYTNWYSGIEDTTVITYHVRGLKSGLVAFRDVFRQFRHWLYEQELGLFSNIDPDFVGFGTSAMDSGMEILTGRPYGGVGFLWRKPYYKAKADCLVLDRPTRKWYNRLCDEPMRPGFVCEKKHL